MIKKHDYDAAWKTILEAFEEEIVELLFPKLYNKINWGIKKSLCSCRQRDTFPMASGNYVA